MQATEIATIRLDSESAQYTPSWSDTGYQRPPAPSLEDFRDQYESEFRIALASQSLWHFAHTYLSHYMSVPSGQFHCDLMGALDSAARAGGRLLGALPREHAKTTIGTVFLVLREVCLQRKRNIVIVGANAREAQAKLRNIVSELEQNPLLRNDFGDSILPARDTKGQFVANTDTEVILANGVRIAAIGIRGKIRGQNDRGVRVDLIVFDDPENDEDVLSETTRRRTMSWINKACLNALDSDLGSLIWLGTLLHFDSALAILLKDEGKDWPQIKLNAIDDLWESPLWPERWSVKKLLKRKKDITDVAFAQEFMNQPIDEASQIYREEWFRWYSQDSIYYQAGRWMAPIPDDFEGALPHGLDRSIPLPLTVIMAVDPAVGLDRRHAYTAYVVLGKQLHTNLLFVMDIIQGRFTFQKQQDGILTLANTWKPSQIGVENVGYQDSLRQAVMPKGLPVIAIKSTGAKQVRIQAGSAHVEAGRVYLPRKKQGVKDFVTQAVSYPTVDQVDMLDAFAMATELITYATNSPAKSGKAKGQSRRPRAADAAKRF